MKILTVNNQQQWDGWLKNNNQYNFFTESWAWGDILLAEGKSLERLAMVEGEEVLAQAQVVYSNLPFGWKYAFCPQGPVIGSQFQDKGFQVYELLIDYLKNKNCIFFRAEPDSEIKNLKFKLNKTIDINPSATLVLDLTKTEAGILSGMHQKTRYNINLAGKKDLQIKNEKNLEVFWNLMKKTGSRDKFGLHHKEHYEKVLASPMACQLTAYEKEKPVACAVFLSFGNTFTYLYGASDYAHRDLMAPYLLQWEGIKIGKSSGCQWYDFFGVAPIVNGNYDPKHQYAGVTRFKLGFGGAPQQRPGTFDIVINNKKYQFYQLLRQLRRLF
ncbi:MAG TPA: peptidoglycan bridge formation glycyltransferase FemA/FemB family protein [Candidatus Udaeobacter sp.]|nr:peptidoglycan bridge formation glycyltransferase FemA/FemB family protein [Candidatus Udaeobacter sp.]